MERLYQSLRRQDNKEFEWLIIDDGSTEGDIDIIQNFLSEKDFSVRYYKKENGGKHTAINYAMQYVKADYCFIVDSDDVLPDNSIDRVLHWIGKANKVDNLAGIGGLRQKLGAEEMIGTTFEGESLICKSSERPKYGITGDKAEVFKTDILKQFPFPEFTGEKFLSESVVWNTISEAGYDILWFNEPIYKGEYLEGGLTNNLMLHYKKSPKGFALYLESLIHQEKVSKIKEWYYYGMYKNVVGELKVEEVAKIFKVKRSVALCGHCIYKIKKVLR